MVKEAASRTELAGVDEVATRWNARHDQSTLSEDQYGGGDDASGEDVTYTEGRVVGQETTNQGPAHGTTQVAPQGGPPKKPPKKPAATSPPVRRAPHPANAPVAYSRGE